MKPMSNKTLLYLTGAVLVGIAALFLVNIASIFESTNPQPYLKFNSVRGIAVQHAGKLYTLNFDQQKEFISILNHVVSTSEMRGEALKRPLIDKIIIYQFNGEPDIQLTPVSQHDQNLVLKTTKWNTDGYVMDISNGSLINLLSQTYDP